MLTSRRVAEAAAVVAPWRRPMAGLDHDADLSAAPTAYIEHARE